MWVKEDLQFYKIGTFLCSLDEDHSRTVLLRLRCSIAWILARVSDWNLVVI